MPTSILNRSMNRFALSPIVSVTAAMLVVGRCSIERSQGKRDGRMQPRRSPHLLQRRLEDIELSHRGCLLREGVRGERRAAATPKRLQRNVGIARFVRRHAHERHGASGPEGDAGDVLLFRRIDHLKAGLHARQHRARRRDTPLWELRIVEPCLVLLQVDDQLRGAGWQDSLERVRARVGLVHPE